MWNAIRHIDHADFFMGLYDEAIHIYSAHDNKRGELLQTCMKKIKVERSTQQNVVVEKNCTMYWIVKNAPRVKSLIRHGISSVERFDVWRTSSYWSPSPLDC
jgi:hypothetical protein